MSLRDQSQISAALRRFDRLASLDDEQLDQLANQSELRRAPPGACLLELGSHEPRQLYLIEGELLLEAADGAAHVVRHTDPAAKGPVSRLRPSRYRVTSRSGVRYLLVAQDSLDSYAGPMHGSTLVVEETYLVSEPNELLDDSASHPLMFDVLHDLNRGQVMVPSDHDIAVRIGRSLDPLETNFTRLADALAICPALTLKTLRAARAASPSRATIRSCKLAVERLGAEQTFALAVNCVLRESLRTDSIVVRERMRSWSERTLRVAAISAVLARMSERFDPEFSRLVGLLHSIAEPVLLGYADRHPDLADANALDNVVHANRAELGRILLAMWDLPREMVEAARLCNHWAYDHPGEANYTDILLVAQWHATIGGRHGRRTPSFADVPAFARLGLQEPEPELSLKIVEEAENAIARIERQLVP